MYSRFRRTNLPEIQETLRHVPLFTGLSQAAQSTLAGDFRLVTYGSNEIIFRQGDLSRELYLIGHGKVRVFITTPAGSETSLNIFSNGSVIGEFAALDGQPRSATAKTITSTHLLGLSAERLEQRLYELPTLAMALARLVVAKARWTATYAETMAQYDAAGRLLHLLLLYNQQFGQLVPGSSRYILNLSLNQTDLASLVGARREWVNRLLRQWQQQNLLEYNNGRIVIFDLARVEAECDRRTEGKHGL